MTSESTRPGCKPKKRRADMLEATLGAHCWTVAWFRPEVFLQLFWVFFDILLSFNIKHLSLKALLYKK